MALAAGGVFAGIQMALATGRVSVEGVSAAWGYLLGRRLLKCGQPRWLEGMEGCCQ